MKFLRAKFVNFRSLRNLELDFKLSGDKHLVVVRAENASGKTTILNGLQWGLYGDEAIPSGRTVYRLHPLDWNLSQGDRVPVTVEIDFETNLAHRTRAGEIQRATTVYRLIRSTSDTIVGDTWRPGPTTQKLFEVTPQGYRPIEPAEATIRQQLPPELREVFFTDGDRALSFIEASVSASTKQAKVRKAIRNLLGLDVVEGARSRVKKAGSAINSKVKSQTSDAELQQTVDRIVALESQVEKHEQELKNADDQFNAFDEELAGTVRKLEEVLSQGGADRTKLLDRIQHTTTSIGITDKQMKMANEDHSQLFRSMELARDLLAPVLAPSFAILDDLRDRGDIPDTTIPVLEDRLGADICICGEQLQGDTTDAIHRRKHIQRIIDQAQHGDASRTAATNLYFASGDLRTTPPRNSSWHSLYNAAARKREDLQQTRSNLGELQASLETELVDDHH